MQCANNKRSQNRNKRFKQDIDEVDSFLIFFLILWENYTVFFSILWRTTAFLNKCFLMEIFCFFNGNLLFFQGNLLFFQGNLLFFREIYCFLMEICFSSFDGKFTIFIRWKTTKFSKFPKKKIISASRLRDFVTTFTNTLKLRIFLSRSLVDHITALGLILY